MPPWREAGLRYFAYGFYLRRRFGSRVQRISLDAGMTCPNVDGTVARGGCAFCDNRSFSPSRRMKRAPIAGQLQQAMRRVGARYRCEHFLAYFQPATNTYAPVERLRAMYEEALAQDRIVGLVIGTRPDCVPDDVLDLIADLAQRTYVSVEYGLQTMHEHSLAWMNRGHGWQASLDAIARSRGRGFAIGAHLILGLPHETSEDMLATAREVARLDIDSVKIHNLYAVKHTPLAEQVQSGAVQLMERDRYVSLLVDILEILPAAMVVERLGGDAPPEYLVAPAWCADKTALRAAIQEELVRRDSWQGKHA